MNIEEVQVAGLLTNYENTLAEYGIGIATRYRLVSSAGVIVHRHENQGLEYLSTTVISDYVREHDEKFFNGTIKKFCYQNFQLQRFMLECSTKLTPTSMYNIKLHIKKLYVHLYQVGLAESTYSALLSFKVNRETKIFSILPKEDIAKMLDTIDRKTVSGKRAYAAMMLGIVLGLRACDIAALRLTDIDCVRGELKILQSKTSRSIALPLTEDVGEAL